MTTNPPPRTPPVPFALLRELAGLALVVLGCAAVIGAAFATATPLGVAVLGACSITAGASMSLGKE